MLGQARQAKTQKVTSVRQMLAETKKFEGMVRVVVVVVMVVVVVLVVVVERSSNPVHPTCGMSGMVLWCPQDIFATCLTSGRG